MSQSNIISKLSNFGADVLNLRYNLDKCFSYVWPVMPLKLNDKCEFYIVHVLPYSALDIGTNLEKNEIPNKCSKQQQQQQQHLVSEEWSSETRTNVCAMAEDMMEFTWARNENMNTTASLCAGAYMTKKTIPRTKGENDYGQKESGCARWVYCQHMSNTNTQMEHVSNVHLILTKNQTESLFVYAVILKSSCSFGFSCFVSIFFCLSISKTSLFLSSPDASGWSSNVQSKVSAQKICTADRFHIQVSTWKCLPARFLCLIGWLEHIFKFSAS